MPGDVQRQVLEVVAPLLVETGDIPAQSDADEALEGLLDPTFAEAADAGGGA